MNQFLPRTRRALALALFLLTATFAWAQEYQGNVRTGLVKVKFSPDMTTTLSQARVRPGARLATGITSLDAVAEKAGAKNMYRLFPYNPRYEAKLRKHGLHLWYVVEIDATKNPADVAKLYKKVSGVTVAEADHQKTLSPYTVTELKGSSNVAPMSAMPFNDPYLPSQWHYHNTGQTGHEPRADINLFEAWKMTAGKRDVIVSIHDQGVDVDHNDLAANMWVNQAEYNGTPNVDDDNNGYIDDIHGWNFDKNSGAIDAEFHGTHVAGTVAAVNNNGIGVSGVAGGTGKNDGALIMSLQTLGGGSFEHSYIYAAENGAVISQNSWGYTSAESYDQSVLDAIDYFIAEAGNYPGSPMKGGIVIFASGNSDSEMHYYPAYKQNVIAVNSIGPNFERAYYSNYGEWTDITSTGGDQSLSGISGVLSTLPNNKVGYIQGTSMACPHVSGIAALALANRTHQFTPDELRNKLLTGVVDIESYNPDFVGKLGSGFSDAKRAVQNDMKIAPAAIADLAVSSIAQEFANLTWTVPADGDDERPLRFQVYYHTSPITAANLSSASKIELPNKAAAGEQATAEVVGLLGLTKYYFVVVSLDRWGNASALSNPAEATTNDGPTIVVDDNSKAISLTINASASESASHNIALSNTGAGLLRWSALTRTKDHVAAYAATTLQYPKVINTKVASTGNLVQRPAKAVATAKAKASTLAFEQQDKTYGWSWPITLIGELDTTLSNSAATRFDVTEDEGFNLTHVQMWLRQNPKKGPFIVEIYKGDGLQKKNLLYAQEYNLPASEFDENQFIKLDEQLYFAQGETFWIVFHAPAGNLYPLGVAEAMDNALSQYCYISFDLGTTWASLPALIHDNRYVWATVASSYNADLGQYLTLTPSGGDLESEGSTNVVLDADASHLINGSYSANVVFKSNDSKQQELRVPVDLTVKGHKPILQSADVVDFGSVFNGKSKEMVITITNNGYGNFNEPVLNISDARFELVGNAPWQIAARDQADVVVRFTPTAAGNANGTLTLTSGSMVHTIALSGVGTQGSTMAITPPTQTFNNLAIGNTVNATVNVSNTGAYPLRYFIPGHDNKGISNEWPDAYHHYGYVVHNSVTDPNPIAYTWNDIATTGTDITAYFKKPMSDYYPVDLDFEFPFYAEKTTRVYIAHSGMISLDNTVQAINSPRLGDAWGPITQIAAAGLQFKYLNSGKIFLQKQADRVIVQFERVQEDETMGHYTFQMVLHDNGNIRFYYKDIMENGSNTTFLTALIEERAKQDGIMVSNYEQTLPWQDAMAIGLDYPGPDIIAAIDNGAGVVMPGESANVKITLDTRNLSQGQVTKSINFISNDPFNASASASVVLNITRGGAAVPVLSTSALDFGKVFQGAVRAQEIVVKNTGTANLLVTNVTVNPSKYNLTGTRPVTITPKHSATFVVTMATATLGLRNDVLNIRYNSIPAVNVPITGEVVPAPAISVDVSAIEETLAHGETKELPFVIKNTGAADLEVAVSGSEWAYTSIADAPVAPSSVADFTYTFTRSSAEGGPTFHWNNVMDEGTWIDPTKVDWEDDASYWKKVDLTWPFNFYGQSYNALYIGLNGLISFDAGNPTAFWTQIIPDPETPNNVIAPLWVPGGFDSYYNPEISGIWYKVYDDKIVISYERMTNAFGMGEPVSVQAILYKSGDIKFQYRAEGNLELVTQFGMIGVENSTGTEAVIISPYQNINVGSGLCYTLSPARKRTIAAGNSIAGTLTLDATDLFAGEYNTQVQITSNAPNRESLTKAVKLTVTGAASIEADEAIDFGEVMAYEVKYADGSMGPKGYQHEFMVTNNGTAPLNLTTLAMKNNDGNTALEVLVQGFWGPEWMPVDWLSEMPVLQPEQTMLARVDIAPDGTLAELNDEVTIATAELTHSIPVTAKVILPPALTINKAPVKVSFNLPSETATRTIDFSNAGGQSDLKYNLSIRYKRAAAVASTNAVAMATTHGVAPLSVTPAGNDVTPLDADVTFNRLLKYEDAPKADSYLGWSGSQEFVSGTQFNGTAEGFNLTHVQTYFRTDDMASGTIEVEIRAGGTNIANAVPMMKMTAPFTATPPGKGTLMTIELTEAVKILPHEDFYVILGYPIELGHPQGFVKGMEAAPLRYTYDNGGIWEDLQAEPSFADFGWYVRAGEAHYEPSAWVWIESETSGAVAKDAASTIALKFTGALAAEGDQKADLVVKTNDPFHEITNVPLTLHLNQAPIAGGISGLPSRVLEQETLDLRIPISDPEGNTFTVNVTETYSRLTWSMDGDVLVLQYKPDYTDAGVHGFVFKAEDKYGAVRMITVPVDVENVNRAPKFTGTTHDLTYMGKGGYDEQNLATFFTDADNDALTFTVATANAEIANVFVAENQFIVRPTGVGDTRLAFVITDSYGAQLKDTLTVTVNNILALEESANHGLKLYPNPAAEAAHLLLGPEWKGEVSIDIADASGRSCLALTANAASGEALLDVRMLQKGFYLVRVTSKEKRATLKLIKD